MRDRITLACTDCKQRNYTSTKNKKNNTERIELKKNTVNFAKHILFTKKLNNNN